VLFYFYQQCSDVKTSHWSALQETYVEL